MGISNSIETDLAMIETHLDRLFDGKQPKSLYAPMKYLLEAGGKRIRPLLVLLSSRSVGGRVEEAIHAACAVELLHTFTLVHDDIMDHDEMRRGRPAVHKQWDEATAILAGDGLVTMAYRALLMETHPRMMEVVQIFTDGLLELCEGQALDKVFETKRSVSIDEYMVMISKKTAKLMEVACEIGGLLGGGSDADRRILGRFAFSLGLGFQIQDDLLDLVSDTALSGKPMGSDLVEKKMTYLTIRFREIASADQRRRFNTIWRKTVLTDEDVLIIRDLFEAAGVFTAARRAVHRLIEESLSELYKLDTSDAKADLEQIAIRIRDRI